MQKSLTQVSDELHELIYNCLSCHAICLETMTECLQKGGRYAEANHLRLLQDCAQICRTSADFMLRGSNFHASIARICADICEQGVISCKAMSCGNDFMTRCAEACHSGAQNCRRIFFSALAASI